MANTATLSAPVQLFIGSYAPCVVSEKSRLDAHGLRRLWNPSSAVWLLDASQSLHGSALCFDDVGSHRAMDQTYDREQPSALSVRSGYLGDAASRCADPCSRVSRFDWRCWVPLPLAKSSRCQEDEIAALRRSGVLLCCFPVPSTTSPVFFAAEYTTRRPWRAKRERTTGASARRRR